MGAVRYRISPSTEWTVIAADASALPAVATILADAPEGARVLLFAEVADAEEQLPFETAASLTTTWLHADGRNGELVAEAIAAASLPAGQGAFWIGLEAASMRVLRRHLLLERQVSRDALHSRAYWKSGVSNHPDHDDGED